MTFDVIIWQNRLSLTTDPMLFSPRRPDPGTLALLRQVQPLPEDRVLDLGCGYGIIGLAVAKKIGTQAVVMIDNDPLAIRTAQANAERNDCRELTMILGDGPEAAGDRTFTLILCNPPYHTDFSVARRFIEEGYRQLETGGWLCFVVKRLDWYRNKMAAVFGGVTVRPIDGYFVLTAQKREKPLADRDASPSVRPLRMTRKQARRIASTKAKGQKTGPLSDSRKKAGDR